MKKDLHARVGAWVANAVAAAFIGACITACGGGSGGSGDGGTPPPSTPIPTDLAITAPATAQMATAVKFSSSAGNLAGLKYSWDFGDGGAASTEASPSHSYAKGGEFDVTLKVTNEAGTSRDVKARVTINNLAVMRGLICTDLEKQVIGQEAGWCLAQPRPIGSQRGGGFFIDAQTGWAFGDKGEIFKTTDAGTNWTQQVSGPDAWVSALRFVDASVGQAVADNGTLLYTRDGGATWRAGNAATTSNAGQKFLYQDALTVVLGNAAGDIRVTTNGGQDWRVARLQMADAEGLQVARDKTFWYQRDGQVFKSADLGVTESRALDLRPAAGAAEFRLALQDDLGVVVLSQVKAVQDGRDIVKPEVRRSRDGGASWQVLAATGLPAELPAGWTATGLYSQGGALLLKSNADLYHSGDGGDTWVRVDPATYSGSIGALGRLGGKAWFSYKMSKSDPLEPRIDLPTLDLSLDDGLTWTRIKHPRPGFFIDIQSGQLAGTQTLVLNAVYGSSAVTSYLSRDLGKTWTAMAGAEARGRGLRFYDVWAFDARRALGLTLDGQRTLTTDGGITWQVLESGLSWFEPRMQFVSDKVGWMWRGSLYRSADGGLTWNAIPAADSNAPGSVIDWWFLDENRGWVIDRASGHLRQTADGGAHWTDAGTLPSLPVAVRFRSSTQGLLLSEDAVHETRDGGKTWARRTALDQGAAIAYADATNAWVTSAGGVMHSSDGGETWVKNPDLKCAGQPYKCETVQFLDAQHGWIGAGALVYATTDGGKTWTWRITPHTLSQLWMTRLQFVDPMTGWAVTRGPSWQTEGAGTLFITGTGGR